MTAESRRALASRLLFFRIFERNVGDPTVSAFSARGRQGQLRAANGEEVSFRVIDELNDLQNANAEMSSVISRLLVIVEAYPDLKANQNFLSLQDELAGTENRIKFERDNYNDAVQSYETSVRTFPGSIVAGKTGFSADKWKMFAAEQGTENPPVVDFKN